MNKKWVVIGSIGVITLALLIIENKKSNTQTKSAMNSNLTTSTLDSRTQNNSNPAVNQLPKANGDQISHSHGNQNAQEVKTKLLGSQGRSQISESDNTKFLNQPALYPKEVQAINSFMDLASISIKNSTSSDNFIKKLNQLGLKPKRITEGPNDEGSLKMVRTENTLDGTRYVHAQFEKNEDQSEQLQHFSFQIRAAKDAFEVATKKLDQVLPSSKKIIEKSKDYILYSINEKYVAWVKIGDEEDLRSNKYNAFAPEDVGTVIVTIEQEIHSHDGHSHD